MIYGRPGIHVDDDQTDRIGIRTLRLSQMWQASRGDMSMVELDGEEPGAPDVPGGLWFIGRQRVRQGGVLRTSWTFEGVGGDGKDVTFKTRGNSPDFGFTPGFAELPIQRNPRFRKLRTDFEGSLLDSEVIWPEWLSDSNTAVDSGFSDVAAAIGLSGNLRPTTDASGGGRPNPMFGQQSYFALQGGTYWYRYAARSEGEIPQIEGKLFTSGSLPGAARSFANRNWLGVGAPYTRRGPVVEVTEMYWLSEEGGWPKPIYR